MKAKIRKGKEKMKSQKGVTLISLTIYVIVMVIVVSMVAVISTYFYTNVRSFSDSLDPVTEYTKFNGFFSDEVNHKNIKVLECKTNYIVFDNGTQYTFLVENKGIYRNQVKIAEGIDNCTFTYDVKNGKSVINVTIKIGEDYTKQMTYTLKK